ncbi:putative BURP domain-containing protein [Medicago truncatula]|uniref:BURP domain protein n=1 Tax=Medicago truncatula TaxID=3880 RepID=A0A072UM33_MEDTR|nr:BURP domain protein [Medicago truncatula]RHN61265.1 putative BURP domain-containing protein [Medicago truncatula]
MKASNQITLLDHTNSAEDLPIPNLDHTEAFKTGYFSLDDLHVGNVMTFQFPVQEVSPYLSKKEANSIPFSMSQLPSILQLFSIPKESLQTKSMRGALCCLCLQIAKLGKL